MEDRALVHKFVRTVLAGAALTGVTPLVEADDALDAQPEHEVVVSTSRNRAERNQDVPLPTSVVSAARLERDNASTATDFARKLPSVTVIQNQPRQSSFSIRGIGKNQNQEAYEGSVGVIIDNVYTVHPGASWGNFFDLDRIEVARGPQGTLLGKNTTMGVVNIATKLPSFQSQQGLELTYANRETVRAAGALTGPLIDDVLAYRISGGYENGDGPIDNAFRPGETLNDLNRFNGRVQLLAKPWDSFTARLSVDYARSAEYNGAWFVNLDDLPQFTNGVGRAAIPPSGGAASGSFRYNFAVRAARFPGRLNTIFNSEDSYSSNDMGQLVSESKGWSGQLDWDIAGGFRLTSISAERRYLFKAHNDYEELDTGYSGGLVHTSQRSQELRITSPLGNAFDYQAGIYYLNVETASGNTPGTHTGPDSGAFQATSARLNGRTYDIFTELNKTAPGRALLRASLDEVYSDSLSTPESESLAYYGQANWHWNERGTLTFGVRYTNEKRTNSNESWSWGGVPLTAENFAGSTALERNLASSIRTTNARSTALISGETEDDSVAWLINPSFKLRENTLLYASAAYGEKSSAVQFLRTNTVVDVLKPERALDFELGVKSVLLDGQLQLNANLFHTAIRDFQTTVYLPDSTATSGYASSFGNADKVTTKGIELDVEYFLDDEWSLSLVGAYNPARYTDYPNGSCPVEVDPSTITAGCDLSGERIGGASDVSAALGVDYRSRPIGNWQWHAFANNAYRSKYNASPTLSSYGDQAGFSLLDAGLGVSFGAGRYDVSLVGKNLLDKTYLISVSDFSNSGVSRGALGTRRFVGLTFRAKFAP